ncbi:MULTISPECIES: hypothetical protein [Streptomyces]|uniref:hypothetical protein n=1 Tax=Streptomyces lycopersici TaxID=2974589 RepID=UPI0021CFAEC1|nr:hypothetical protein [Streptomyces sp. NEAU-383]
MSMPACRYSGSVSADHRMKPITSGVARIAAKEGTSEGTVGRSTTRAPRGVVGADRTIPSDRGP